MSLQTFNNIDVKAIKYNNASSTENGTFMYFRNGTTKKTAKGTFVPKIEGTTPAILFNGALKDKKKPDVHPSFAYIELHELDEAQKESNPLSKAQFAFVDQMEAIQNQIVNEIFENQADIFKNSKKKIKQMTKEKIKDLSSRMWNQDEVVGKLQVKIPFAFDGKIEDKTQLTSLANEAFLYDDTKGEKTPITATPQNITQVLPKSITKVFLRLAYVSFTNTERFNYIWHVHQVLILKYIPLIKQVRQMSTEDYENNIRSSEPKDPSVSYPACSNELQDTSEVKMEGADPEDDEISDGDSIVGSDDSA